MRKRGLDDAGLSQDHAAVRAARMATPSTLPASPDIPGGRVVVLLEVVKHIKDALHAGKASRG